MPYADPARQRAAKTEWARRRRAAQAATTWPPGARVGSFAGPGSVLVRATAEVEGETFPVQLQFGGPVDPEAIVLTCSMEVVSPPGPHPLAVAFRQWADAIDAGRDPWNP